MGRLPLANRLADRAFETQQRRAAFFGALQNLVVPLKYAYIGSAARTHARLAQQQGYRDVTDAASDESQMLLSLLPANARTSIVDFGPGDGRHSASFLRQLTKKGREIAQYQAVDFSRGLLDVATARIADTVGGLGHICKYVGDLETASSLSGVAYAHERGTTPVCLLLGHTLGNMESPLNVLRNLRSVAPRGVRFLLSVSLESDQSAKAIIAPYLNPIFFDAALEPLRMIGVRAHNSDFSVYYDTSLRTVLGIYRFPRPALLHSLGNRAKFKKGDIIRCFMSRRFVREELFTLLNSAGWKVTASTIKAHKLIVHSVTKGRS